MMLRYQGEKLQRRRWFIGGATILGVTIALLSLPLGDKLAKLSYDLPFLFRGRIADTNVVVVLEDRASLDALLQTNFPPARTIHAQLLDKLREEGAGRVIFDISFRAPKPGEDEAFAEAIRRHGHVILGGVLETATTQFGDSSGTRIVETIPPAERLRAAAAGWGLLIVGDLDSQFGVRRIIAESKGTPTVPWLAAEAGGHLRPDQDSRVERWINFYGTSPALDQVTLGDLLGVAGRSLPLGFWRGKVVFVGFDPSVTPVTGRRDVFATPFTRPGSDFTPGVEILANVYANLANGDWLRRLPVHAQILLAVLFGLSVLAVFICAGPRWLWPVALVSFGLLTALSLVLQWHFHFWWNWAVPAFVQLPLTTLLMAVCPRLPIVAFISYRREGGKHFAKALLGELRARGKDALLDVNEIESGEFPPQIFGMIERVPNFLLVLSPNALAGCVNPKDWVRQEIAHALGTKKILPIFLEGFDPKSLSDLPLDLNGLDLKHGFEHHHNTWEATLDWIESQLER